MNRFLLLPFLMALSVSLQAQTGPAAIMNDEASALKRYAERLRYELKRESDQRMAERNAATRSTSGLPDADRHHIAYHPITPAHFSLAPAFSNEATAYKERLDSLVSLMSSKQLFSYDDQGHLLTKETQKWKNSTWIPESLFEHTYQPHSDWPTRYIEYSFVGTDFVPLTATFNKYIEGNRQIIGYAQWNEAHQDWRFSYLQESLLDDQGREIAYTYYTSWDDAAWQPSGVYEHYEVDYQPEGAVTTLFHSDGTQLVPYERVLVQNDPEQRYTILKETQVYVNGEWNTRDYQKELREYYGDNEWNYLTTYYESLTSYNTSGRFDYGTKRISTYDDHHHTTLAEEYSWESFGQKWIGSSRNEYAYHYTYNEQPDYESYITTRNASLYGWNSEHDTWDYGYLSETDYDDSGEWCYSAQASWSPVKKDWVYSYREKIDRTFDQEGRIVLIEQMIWDSETSQWCHPMISTSYEYADDGLVTMIQFDRWNESLGQWQAGRKELTRRDDHGSIVYDFGYTWNSSQQCFVPSSYAESQYIYEEGCSEGFMRDGRADACKIEFSNWSEELGTWQYGRKDESEYDEHYHIIHHQTSFWVPKRQEFYLEEDLHQLFDETGNMTLYQLDRYTEDGNQDFEYHEKWTKRYDANNNLMESCTYEYSHTEAAFWLSERNASEYDLVTAAPEVMGLYDLGFFIAKPLSSIYQIFGWTGAEIHREECYFYYSSVGEGGEGIAQMQTPMTIEVSDGQLTLSSESAADITIHSLDGKLIGSALQVRTYSLPLAPGSYVVVVNGVSRVVRV